MGRDGWWKRKVLHNTSFFLINGFAQILEKNLFWILTIVIPNGSMGER